MNGKHFAGKVTPSPRLNFLVSLGLSNTDSESKILIAANSILINFRTASNEIRSFNNFWIKQKYNLLNINRKKYLYLQKNIMLTEYQKRISRKNVIKFQRKKKFRQTVITYDCLHVSNWHTRILLKQFEIFHLFCLHNIGWHVAIKIPIDNANVNKCRFSLC